MKRNSKKIISVVLATVIVASGITGCSLSRVNNEEPTDIETTTTTTTKPTTTEDIATTFKENETQKVYPGLEKDTKGEYPYELATYSTTYSASNATRTANLKAAVDKLDNIKIPAGEVFSFNQTVGKRTVTAGYKTATVINGGEFVDGLGGGVCQVSSTVFECVLRANIEIVYRTYHSLEIGYVPLGGDATVQWNSKDFKFKNNLGCDVKLEMTCANGRLTCTLYGKEDVRVDNVKINITKNGGEYVLTRTVNGEQNYRTVSRYKKPVTTTKATTTKKKEKDKKEKTTKSLEEQIEADGENLEE